ncbi:MAG: DUF5330 domain-containing protein [Pseudomonadota bacterium]
MIRLILALGVAGALWPIDHPDSSVSMPPKRMEFELSSMEILNAAYSIYEDVGSFCERNTETCITGAEAFNTVYTNVQSRLNSGPVRADEQSVQAIIEQE